MPILMLLSNRYVQIALIIFVALAGMQVYGARQHSLGYLKAQAEYTQRALAATQAARAREAELQIKIQEAQNEARKRENDLSLAADAARAERDGLRDELTAIGDRLSKASADSLRKYARTANAVLAECTTRYSELAKKADQHASDSLMLQQGWPSLKAP